MTPPILTPLPDADFRREWEAEFDRLWIDLQEYLWDKTNGTT